MRSRQRVTAAHSESDGACVPSTLISLIHRMCESRVPHTGAYWDAASQKCPIPYSIFVHVLAGWFPVFGNVIYPLSDFPTS